jgi:hypothetical protein
VVSALVVVERHHRALRDPPSAPHEPNVSIKSRPPCPRRELPVCLHPLTARTRFRWHDRTLGSHAAKDRRYAYAASRVIRSCRGSRRVWGRTSSAWIEARVAVASRAGSAARRSLRSARPPGPAAHPAGAPADPPRRRGSARDRGTGPRADKLRLVFTLERLRVPGMFAFQQRRRDRRVRIGARQLMRHGVLKLWSRGDGAKP